MNMEYYFFYISFIIKINKNLQFLVDTKRIWLLRKPTQFIFIFQAIISNKIEVNNFIIVVIDKFSIFFSIKF